LQNLFRISKTVNAPLGYVYRWCTDLVYDPVETSGEPERRLLRKTKRTVIFVELYEGSDGRQRVGTDILDLRPPSAWHLEYFGEDNDEIGDYRLKKLGSKKTEILMRFRNHWKIDRLSLTTEEKRRIESDFWEKRLARLESDYTLKGKD
jgi:hypothetical protein